MAKKPLAGKKWFDALGRSERSRGVPLSARSAATLKRQTWPDWAVTAYMRGWINQSVNHAKAKTANLEVSGNGVEEFQTKRRRLFRCPPATRS